jgi:hypothetical protein
MNAFLSCPAAKEDPFWRLSVPDAAQRSFALAEGPHRRGMERGVCRGPRQPMMADDHRPIGEPGGDQVPRQFVGGAMPRSRGVGAAFDRRFGYPDASRVRCPCRLDGPSHHRYRYHARYAERRRRENAANEPSPVVSEVLMARSRGARISLRRPKPQHSPRASTLPRK